MADQKSYKWFKLFMVLIAMPSILLLGIAWYVSGSCLSMNGSIWLCLLFGGPVLIQALGLWHLDSKFVSNHHLLDRSESKGRTADADNETKDKGKTELSKSSEMADLERGEALVIYSKVYLISMGLCLITYSGLWLAFATGVYWWVFSFIALGVIGILLLIVMVLTRAIINHESPAMIKEETYSKSHYLKLGAAQAPFLTLLFFLTIFLGVSYLLGFALAFHDKSQPSGHPALYSRNLDNLSVVPSYSPPLLPPPALHNLSFPPWQTYVIPSDPELTAIIIEIGQLVRDHKSVYVTVTGHAVENPKDRRTLLRSADARAQSTKKAILDRVHIDDKWQGFRLISETQTDKGPGASNFVEVKIEQNPEDLTSSRVGNLELQVKAQLDAAKPKSLDLMDYVYFANYTITTTGYGDIMPNTVYAKFICSFANICEVFFLVVFFNALLSLSGHQMMSTMAEQVSVLHEIHGSARKRG
jgi:hypothetical protein